MRRIRVLYVHQDGNLSGSLFSLLHLLSGLDRSRFEPRVLLCRKGPAEAVVMNQNIPVDVLDVRGFWTCPSLRWFSRDYWQNWLALMPNDAVGRYLDNIKPDLVHVNDKAAMKVGAVAAELGLPVVWHLRSTYKTPRETSQTRVSMRVIRRAAKALIAISEDETEGFEGSNQLRVIHNPVDLELARAASSQRDAVRRELGVEPDEVLIGMVGALSGLEGAWDFIRVAGVVAKACPEHKPKFAIVGSIPGRGRRLAGWNVALGIDPHPLDHAHRLANQSGVRKQLILTGRREDALAAIAAFDILVVCNQFRALGRPPLEAMALGRPVVATDGHSRRSHIILEGQTGFVVPPGDLAAFAERIIQLVKDSELRDRLGHAGLTRAADCFDLHHHARLVQNVYESVMEGEST